MAPVTSSAAVTAVYNEGYFLISWSTAYVLCIMCQFSFEITPGLLSYWSGHSSEVNVGVTIPCLLLERPLFIWVEPLSGLHVRRVTTCPNACSQGQETCWIQELGTPNNHHSLKHGRERWQNHLGYALTLEMWCIEENKYKVLKLTTNSWFWVLQTVSRQLHLSKCSNSTFQHKA